MVEQIKRKRGRPKGSKDRVGRKPRTTAAAFEAGAGQPHWPEEPAPTNGQDYTLYDQAPVEPAPARLQVQGMAGQELERPQPVDLPDLFIHRVENGYIVRPAFPQGDRRTSTDARTWVVADKPALAALVIELIAEPVLHPRPIPQPEGFYSPPLIVETATGPPG